MESEVPTAEHKEALMNYRSYLDQVMELPFINDEKAADAAIKTVLGVLTAKVPENDAVDFCNVLPPELGLESLSSNVNLSPQLSVDDFFFAVGESFHLSWQQARDLVGKVFHCVKESEDGIELMQDMENKLPEDWAAVVDQA